MKVANFCWGVCATILVAGTAQADGADRPFDALDDSPRFMLYVHKQLGSAPRQSKGPSFGFAVDRSTPLWSRGDSPAPASATARIFDLRVAPFDDSAIFLNGLQLTGSAQQGLGYEGSYGEGASWNNPWLWFAAALGAAIGISCLTDNWPCEDSYDGDSGYRVPGE
jgi:hypothetical protein